MAGAVREGFGRPLARSDVFAVCRGLIGPGDRKSIQPMAAREGVVGYDQLYHFVAAGTWDRAPVEAVLLKAAGQLMGGEHRSTGARKYYLSNLPADATLKRLAGAVKARWACEQAHQRLKEKLGLDHFEGRSWSGRHRHALMSMIAYAFLQSRRINPARGKRVSGPPPQPSLPATRQAILDQLFTPKPH